MEIQHISDRGPILSPVEQYESTSISGHQRDTAAISTNGDDYE
jgi:hypothetical protein